MRHGPPPPPLTIEELAKIVDGAVEWARLEEKVKYLEKNITRLEREMQEQKKEVQEEKMKAEQERERGELAVAEERRKLDTKSRALYSWETYKSRVDGGRR